MDRADARTVIMAALQTGIPGNKRSPVSIVERVDPRIRALEQLPELESRLLAGKKTTTTFKLNGLSFAFDALTGQKDRGIPRST